MKNLENRLKSYINDTLKFDNDSSKKYGYVLNADDIKHREIQLAIPYGTSTEKMKAIQNAINYGKSKNVKVIVTITQPK